MKGQSDIFAVQILFFPYFVARLSGHESVR